MKLVHKILLGVASSVLVVMASMGYYSSVHTQQIMRQQLDRLLLSNLEITSTKLHDNTQHVMRTTEIIAQNPALPKA